MQHVSVLNLVHIRHVQLTVDVVCGYADDTDGTNNGSSSTLDKHYFDATPHS